MKKKSLYIIQAVFLDHFPTLQGSKQSFSVKKSIALVCFVPLNTVIKNLICIAGKAGNFHVLSVVKVSNFMVCDRLIEKLF